MKRANGGSLLGRVGRKSEMRRTSNAGARSVEISGRHLLSSSRSGRCSWSSTPL